MFPRTNWWILKFFISSSRVTWKIFNEWKKFNQFSSWLAVVQLDWLVTRKVSNQIWLNGNFLTDEIQLNGELRKISNIDDPSTSWNFFHLLFFFWQQEKQTQINFHKPSERKEWNQVAGAKGCCWGAWEKTKKFQFLWLFCFMLRIFWLCAISQDCLSLVKRISSRFVRVCRLFHFWCI